MLKVELGKGKQEVVQRLQVLEPDHLESEEGLECQYKHHLKFMNVSEESSHLACLLNSSTVFDRRLVDCFLNLMDQFTII